MARRGFWYGRSQAKSLSHDVKVRPIRQGHSLGIRHRTHARGSCLLSWKQEDEPESGLGLGNENDGTEKAITYAIVHRLRWIQVVPPVLSQRKHNTYDHFKINKILFHG